MFIYACLQRKSTQTPPITVTTERHLQSMVLSPYIFLLYFHKSYSNQQYTTQSVAVSGGDIRGVGKKSR